MTLLALKNRFRPTALALRSTIARIAVETHTQHATQKVCALLGVVFILAYHDVPPETFARHIEALKPNRPVHLSELVQRARSGRSTAGLFAVTIDDGVATTVRQISAVCQQRSWPVTFYLPTAYLDERRGLPFQVWAKVAPYLPHTVLALPAGIVDLSTAGALAQFERSVQASMETQCRQRYEPLLDQIVSWLVEHEVATPDQLRTPEPISWREVTELSKDEAIRFESHGVSHTAVVALSSVGLEAELKTSKQRISEHTNRDCRHFCYPYGGSQSIGVNAPEIVSTVFESATTMARGRLRHHSWSLLPRIPLYERDDPTVARLKILTL